MKDNGDIGENLAIVLFSGIVVGAPLLFTGWLFSKALSMALPSVALGQVADVKVTQLKQTTSAEVRFIPHG